MTPRRLGIGVGIAAVVAAGVVLAWQLPGWRSGEVRPNVLLVVWDTARADRMSLYGHSAPTTPRLEALADQSVVYEHAVSPAMWTVPAHASMFTGLHPATHGANGSWKWLDGHHQTLAERLSGAGYDTWLFSTNLYVTDKTNLTQGFAERHYSWGPGFKKRCRQAGQRKLLAQDASTEVSPSFAGNKQFGWGKQVFKDCAPIGVDAALKWVDARPAGTPWFAMLNLMEAHSPRVPSQAARDVVMDPRLQALALRTDASQAAVWDYTFGTTTYREAELEAIRGVYDASLAELDHATGRLIDGLAGLGLLDDTIVVITSDHGELLGEHRLFEHRFALYEPLVHVPLVIRYPKKLAPERVQGPVSTVGLSGTLGALTGVAAGPPLQTGSPVFSAITSTEPKLIQRYAPTYPEVDWAPWLRTMEAVVDGSHKRIAYSDGQVERFDLRADPGELVSLDGVPWDATLQAALEAWRETRVPYDPGLRAPDEGPPDYDPEELEQLRALGYVHE